MKTKYVLVGYIKRPCQNCSEDKDCLVLENTLKLDKPEILCKDCVKKKDLVFVKK